MTDISCRQKTNAMERGANGSKLGGRGTTCARAGSRSGERRDDTVGLYLHATEHAVVPGVACAEVIA